MNVSPVIQWGENFINKFDLHHCEHILDIGCRQGQLSKHLAKRYQQSYFVAIDNLVEEIQQAKQDHLSNLNFELADALSLNYTDYFDAIVSFSCLHWIKNKSKVLYNIYRALKPGGKVYLQFFATHGRPKNDRFLYQVASSLNWKDYFKGFEPDYSEISVPELCALLENLGFVIHKFEFVTYESTFEHAEMLHHWLKSWASHKNRIPSPKQDHFLQETVHSYLSHNHYSENERFPYYECLLEIVCEKKVISQDELLPTKIFCQSGQVKFTHREIDVLKHYLKGNSAKEIALLISISAKAVEFHLANIKEKLNCSRRSEIYQAALSSGFIHLIF